MFMGFLAESKPDRRPARWLSLLLLLVLITSARAELVEDVQGHQVDLARRPTRIVSLSPSITEILFAIGCDTTNVVGVTTFCNYPPAATSIAQVGGIVDPSLEAILQAAPDLVLATRGNTLEFMESLNRLDIPVFAIEGNGDLREIIGTIVQIGLVVGRSREAEALAEKLNKRLDLVLAKTAAIERVNRPRVYFGELDGAHWTPGPGSFVHALIEASGGANIGAVAQAPWSPLALEVIFEQDPEVMLAVYGDDGEAAARREIEKIVRSSDVWSQTSLGRQGRIYLILADRIQRPGPRVFDVLEEVSRYLHPEIWNQPSEAND